MRTNVLLSLLCASAIALIHGALPAHGGIYRGPGDVVPPSPGGGRPPIGTPGPVTPGAKSPSSPVPHLPGPPTPSTGGGTPAAGSPRPAGRTTGGVAIEPDLATWDFWWEFNKDSYLRLKDAVHAGGAVTGDDRDWVGRGLLHEARDTLRPTRDQILTDVLPALRAAMAATGGIVPSTFDALVSETSETPSSS
jgi:hypothetical protein